MIWTPTRSPTTPFALSQAHRSCVLKAQNTHSHLRAFALAIQRLPSPLPGFLINVLSSDTFSWTSQIKTIHSNPCFIHYCLILFIALIST